MKRLLAGAALAVSAVVLTACGSGSGGGLGSGLSSGNTPASDSSGADSSVDPSLKVSEPLNGNLLASDPCAVFSSSQLSQLDLGTGEQDTSRTTNGLRCTWVKNTENKSNSVSITLLTLNPHGISDIYDEKKTNPDKYEFFEPTTVAGYPAVANSPLDSRDHGDCPMQIAINDQQTMAVIVQFSDFPTDPCGLATQFGEQAIQTLKAHQ